MWTRACLAVLAGACLTPALAGGSTVASSKFPTFGKLTYYKTAKHAGSLAIGDLNGDGRPDLALAGGGGCFDCQGVLSVLLNKGGGKFEASRNKKGPQAGGFVIADVNGDRKPDLVGLANYSGLTPVVVFIGNGDGTFAEPSYYAAGDFDHAPGMGAIGDLNGDGKLDLVTTNDNRLLGPGSISVLINRGDGTFATNVDYPTEASFFPTAAAIGDLNRDGKADVVVANDGPDVNVPGAISVFLGRGDGTLKAPRIYQAGLRPIDVTIADLNGDGKPDLVSPSQQEAPRSLTAISIFLNKGDGTFQPRRDMHALCRRTGSVRYCGVMDMVVGDLNGDGRPDLVLPALVVLLNRGDGTFPLKRAFHIYFGFAPVAIRDVSGDNKPDVLGLEGGGVGVLLNTTR